MTGRMTIYFIMITVVSSGMIIMSGCGKKVTTTRMSETVKPAEISQRAREVLERHPLLHPLLSPLAIAAISSSAVNHSAAVTGLSWSHLT